MVDFVNCEHKMDGIKRNQMILHFTKINLKELNEQMNK